MPVLYSDDFTFQSRGAHPFLTGASINVSGPQATQMSAIDGSAASLALTGTTNAGVLEFQMAVASTITVPAGQVLVRMSVEVVARIASPILYTTQPFWTVELYDSRTSATIGALNQTMLIPIQSALVGCVAGGLDLWGVDQATIISLLAAGALRIRLVSPGWSTSSTGALVIDGVQLVLESAAPAAATRQGVQLRRSGVPGKIPVQGDLLAGELAVNLADLQLLVGDGARTAQPLLIPTRFSVNARYLPGQMAILDARIIVCTVATGPGAYAGAAAWMEYNAATATFATSAGNSSQLASLSLTFVYELMHPFWSVRDWRGTISTIVDYNNFLAAAGCPARWWIADGNDGRPNAIGRVVWGAGQDSDLNVLAGAFTVGTFGAGGHSHGANTFATALSAGNLPGLTTTTSRVDRAIGSTPTLDSVIASYVGSAGHLHGIPFEGDHAHSVNLDIPRIYWWHLVRYA